jgi:hypothetical protein
MLFRLFSCKLNDLVPLQSTIGQAHLLDSIIDNLELEEADGLPEGKPSYYARRTLTYGLGEQVSLAASLLLKKPA